MSRCTLLLHDLTGEGMATPVTITRSNFKVGILVNENVFTHLITIATTGLLKYLSIIIAQQDLITVIT